MMANTTDLIATNDSLESVCDKKILIIDDSKTVVRIVAKGLRMGGFANVCCETDSLAAMKVIHDFMPDMIILDLFMPGIDGFQILTELRSDRFFDRVVVLMLSSAGESERLKALEMGATGFVNKPARPEELIQTITRSFRLANRFGAV